MDESKETDQSYPNYTWPEGDTQRNCPKCGIPLQLNEQRPQYYGKPWWCGPCKWQFSEEDFS